MPEAEQALTENMAAYVEGTSREVILAGEDHEDLLKPALGLKPRLTPKPFSLQRNTAIRSILAPKSIKTAPQPAVDAALPSTTSSTESAAAPKLNLNKESELSEAGTLPFSSTDKLEATGVLNSSSATPVQKESTPTLKPNIPTDLQITTSTKEKPGSLPESQKPTLCPACFESSSSPALPDINPKVDPTNLLNQKELGRTQSQAETQANTNMSTVASQEVLSKGEEKENTTSPALPPMSQDSDVSASSTDTPVANPTPQWGHRNRLSMKLTSKFESGMLSPTTEYSQPQEGKKDSCVKEGEMRPGRLVASEPARSPISSAPRRREEEEGGGKIAEKEVGWEETTGGSSIRRRISLLFDSSSRPEVPTRREEPGALCQSNGVGDVKQRIKVWASEAASIRMLETTPPSIQSLRRPPFDMADSFPEENSLKEVSPKIHDAEDSPEKILGSSTGVAQLLKQFERSEDIPKDVPTVDKPLEMTAEKSVERDTENSKSSDTRPDLPLKSIIAQPNFDKRPALRRSVRFALEVQEFESPPGSPGLESDVESEDLSGSDDPEAGEDKGSKPKPLHEIGGLQKRQEDHNETKKTEEKEEKRRAQERQKEKLGEEKERKLESELETQKQIEEERQKEQEREKLRREVKQKEERERLALEREREIEEERETLRRLERQKEEERERLALERERKIEDDPKKEDERLRQMEVERERKIIEERQKEKERQRLALKRERQREDEKRKEEERVRQLELKRERIQVEEMRKEDERKKDRERQEEIETERQREKTAREKEIKKQAEKEERLREDEKKREDQEKIKKQEEERLKEEREQDKRRKEEEEKEREIEMEKEREREKQVKIEKEKLETLEKSLQKDREDARERMRIIEMEKQREKERERQRGEERERVRQQEVEMLRETDRLKEMERQKELKQKEEVEKRLKEEQREKQMELENQRKRELEEEMENQRKRELEEEMENQRKYELEEETERERQKKEKDIVKKQEEEMERQRGGGTKELVCLEMEQRLREESKSWTGEEREPSKTHPVNSMNFTSPQPELPLTSSDPKSKEDTNSEPTIEVVYDDFSVSRPLVEVIYEDFSVKPRRWGSKAKVPLTNSRMELSSAGVEILKPDAEEPSQPASLDTGPTEDQADENIQRFGATDQEENSDPSEQVELFVSSGGTEREEKVIGMVENQVKEEEEKVIFVVENQVQEETDEQKEQLTSCTQEGDTEALFGAEADQQYGGCDSTSALDSSPSPQSILTQGPLVPPQDTDPDQPLFPETTAPLLDNRAQKSKAQLGKRRSVRTRPPRLVNQSSSLTSHTEILAQDWRACHSAEGNMVSPTSGDGQSEKEQPRGKETSQPTPSSHRVALFAGLDPSALMAQLKKRGGGTDDWGDDKDGVAEVAAPAPSQLAPSPRSPFLPGATRVLPPIGSKAGEGINSSPSWLQELKSKKRLSQYDSET